MINEIVAIKPLTIFSNPWPIFFMVISPLFIISKMVIFFLMTTNFLTLPIIEKWGSLPPPVESGQACDCFNQ